MKRERVIQVRVLEEEYRTLVSRAAKSGMKPPEWLRVLGLVAAGSSGLTEDLKAIRNVETDIELGLRYRRSE